jgi:small-conductance mechanosensitive channel
MIEILHGAVLAQGLGTPTEALPMNDLVIRSVQSIVLLVVGVPLVFVLARWVRAGITKKYSPQQGLISGKLVFYPGLLMVAVTILHQLNFSLTPLLGAAGIVGIALGFASQTSVSNIISGFFLIAEKPFEVGDMIQVGDTLGIVLSIDTLSVKLRTFDNRFVRIPNETIIKTQVTNVTRFPIRRLDLEVGVAYKEKIGRIREVLLDVVAKNPKALMEPAPLVMFDAYGDSALELKIRVWAIKTNILPLKNALLEEIKDRFDEEGIEIPFPHRSLYTGEVTDPFPIRIVPDMEAEEALLDQARAGDMGAEAGAGPVDGDPESGGGPGSETGDEDDRPRQESVD